MYIEQVRKTPSMLWDKTGKRIESLAKIIDSCPVHARDEAFALSIDGFIDAVNPRLIVTDEDVGFLVETLVAPLVRLVMERNEKKKLTLSECFKAKKELVFTEEPMTEEERTDLVNRAKAMIERMKPFKDAHEDETPDDIKIVLLINKWMNPWAAINELEKIVSKYRT